MLYFRGDRAGHGTKWGEKRRPKHMAFPFSSGRDTLERSLQVNTVIVPCHETADCLVFVDFASDCRRFGGTLRTRMMSCGTKVMFLCAIYG